MHDLSTDIRYLKGIGEARAKALAKLGVHTFGDLLEYFPAPTRTAAASCPSPA